MRQDIIDKLMELKEEEKEILEGKNTVGKNICT